ncbi:MAG: cyclic nucleotide-binding domain-containing protein, partial [Fidelibacterota bacterium]
MKQVKLDSSVNLDCLKKSKFFQDINSVYLESIASSCINISTEKGEVLFIAGENNLAGIFYLISGKVILSSTEDDTDVERTNEVLKDETFNSLSIFYEMTRTETASALEASNLLFVPKQALIDSCEKNPAFNTILHEKIAIEFNREKLLRILSKVYSKDVDQSIIRKIIDSGEWVSLKSNSKLFKAGDPSDSMLFLVRGFLKVFIGDDDNLKEVGEIKEGEVIGEMGLLSDEPRSASIYSTRESILFKISKEKFDNLMRNNPSVLFALSKQIILRFKKNQNVNTSNENTLFLTLLFTSKDRNDPIVNHGIGKYLDSALGRYDSSYFLSKEIVEKELSVKDINIELGLDGKFFPLDNFVNRIAKNHKYIILETEVENTPWTTWCIKLSDKFLFLVNPAKGIQNDSIINAMNEIQVRTPNHLLVDR